MSKTLAKRYRRKLWGGRVDARIYTDGSVRFRVDHPSNDPAIELAMGGAVLSMARDIYAKLEIPFEVGAIRWNDDP